MNSEWAASAADEQKIAWLAGSVHRVIFDGSVTENRLTAFRSSMRTGAASPVHIHDEEDETIFVLEGSGVFWAGHRRWELSAGDSVFLPRRVPHSYVFTSDTEILTVCNPAGMEDFFRRVGWDLADPLPEGWAVDMDELKAAGEATGQHVLGPPLAPGDDMPARFLG